MNTKGLLATLYFGVAFIGIPACFWFMYSTEFVSCVFTGLMTGYCFYQGMINVLKSVIFVIPNLKEPEDQKDELTEHLA